MPFMTLRSLALAGAIVLRCAAADTAPIDVDAVIPRITLSDGRTLTHLQIITFGTRTVMAKWDGGRGTILYSLLPDNIRAITELYRPSPLPHSPAAPKGESTPAPKRVTPVPTPDDPLDAQVIAKEKGLLREDLLLVTVTPSLGSFQVEVKNLTSSYKLFPWQKLVGRTGKGDLLAPADIITVGEDSSLIISPEQTRTFNVGFHIGQTPGSAVETVTWSPN